MVKIGLVGAGFMGRTHAQAYTCCTDAAIKRVCDGQLNRAETLANEVGAQANASFDEIVRDPEIDLVDICLPTPYHTGHAIRALEAGKHVLVEKPLALTLPEVDAIHAAARLSGRFLMVGHVLRFWPEYQAIREVLRSGRLGPALQASAYRLTNKPQWSTWFADPRMTGGAVLDLHIHDLDLLNWLFGPPATVFARGVKGETGGWDYVMTQVSYPGISASAEASFMMPKDYPFTAGLRVLCEGGVVEYHFRAGGASFEQGQPVKYLLLHEPGKPSQSIPVGSGDAFEREMAYFVECVQSGAPPTVVTPADARLAIQTCLAARQSLETGMAVEISG